ncbi:MAG TPA: hypothetical protein VFX51_01850 [Solirubrobacteraceae bacterium]|nr:hypothetical protein [Solirubrobacteraceae bacterium]
MLRVFAVDPGMTAKLETATINEATLAVRWEELDPGPVGEYVAVIDRDQAGTVLHDPVDLDARDVLAQGGLVPSDGNPQFRQQMTYAVAMQTIASFERGLGRPVHWQVDPDGAYRAQLALRPHFMEEPNAYYNPGEGICFGYFAAAEDALLPGTVVFTCLSQDVIAHQLAHAVLAGLGVGFEGGAAGDDAALHEAFADLVALFQHFEDNHVLRTQIAAVRGDLLRRSLLGAVAPQFGQAMPGPKPDGLRNALGVTDDKGRWRPRRPDSTLYRATDEPHARGDILVAAVFRAFHAIYEARVADLRRLASRGTGVLAKGELHPDLVGRLTREARRSARHVLQMCIRALDYLPPVDVTFGDFLRAIVTADYDVVPPDDRQYRIAFVEAFRSYGIVPPEVRTLSTDTLLWRPPPDRTEAAVVLDFIAELAGSYTYWNLPNTRQELWEMLEGWKADLAGRLKASAADHPRLGPIELAKPFEIRTLELRDRAEASTELTLLWVIKLVQEDGEDRRGCTLLIDAERGRVRYRIDKPTAQVGTGLLAQTSATPPSPPGVRNLRVFAFDPSLGVEIATAGINEVTLAVPWERDARGEDILRPGPVGEYLEVIDHDPSSGCFYEPVDLNDARLLAQDGLTPSESNPQFHQQMVYAVAMRTIRQFELALGRLALWASQNPGEPDEAYVQRLRVHPHALREANAYYSPAKKALLFGYFSTPASGGDETGTGVTVFTSLSHDIVAHEVTHALLDGIHRRFSEPSNPDVLAFHEAFADLVALLQHFSLPEVLRHQIAYTRGDLESQNQLGELAQQFGQAIGNRGALRSAIGSVDPATGEWRANVPDPADYQRRTEPHDRGAILVAAVFDAFLSIYKVRAADLLRIATEGSGELPPGQLHPDLVDRLADEAATAAGRVLHMCIRALDYCPPVDITFGEYLRALVTADYEANPVDEDHRRVAFAESFRRYGIVPENVRTLSVDGLLWRPASAAPDEDVSLVVDLVGNWAVDLPSWNLTRDREALFELMAKRRAALHQYLKTKLAEPDAAVPGLDLERPFEVHSLRPALGSDPHGRARLSWVVELTQSEKQWFDPDGEHEDGKPDFWFRNGTTLIIDAQTGEVRYSIRKPPDQARRERQREFHLDEGSRSLAATYLGGPAHDYAERFAAVHRL